MKTPLLSGTHTFNFSVGAPLTVDLSDRHAAPAPGTVLWYRQYRFDPKNPGRWGPTGRPRKAVFVRFHERDARDDKWEVSDWRCFKRGLRGCTYIGSKSLQRIEPSLS
jgi:hypothetical protein